MDFSGGYVLPGHCADIRDVESGLQTTKVTRPKLDDLYRTLGKNPNQKGILNMKRLLIVSSLALIACLAGTVLRASAVEKKEAVKELRHIVMFKFSSEDAAREVSEAFVNLESEIDLIKGLEWGTNVSKEKLDKGLTHAFTLTFHSQEDLDAYIVHPAHKAFAGGLDGKVVDVCVFDYWAK